MIKGFSKKPQCSEEQLLEVKEAFNVFDSEQTGGLDARELKAAISALNIKIILFFMYQIIVLLHHQTNLPKDHLLFFS